MSPSTETTAVIVTGAGSGIGREIALQAATSGLAVAAWDIDEAALSGVATEISGAGGQVTSAVVDVSSPADVERGLDQASTELGLPRLLVNNAGPPSSVPIEFDAGVHAALGSLHLVTEAWLARDPGPDPAVVNIASVAGALTGAGTPWYGCSKAAIAGYTRVLAVSRPKGVRANAVAPGIIRTPRTVAIVDGSMGASYVDRNPMHRFGEPEDVAHAVLFLLGPGASYINGVLLAVDGGATIVL